MRARPSGPTGTEDEHGRIETHLSYVLEHLRTTDPPNAYSSARAANLDRLESYIERGLYPRNDDYPTRRPTFVDDGGTRCAVAFLAEHDLGPRAILAVAVEHKYSYVPDIDSPELLAWARTSGLTLDELAMIQPAYPSMESPEHTPAFATLDRVDGHPRFALSTGLLMGTDDDGLHLRSDVFGQYLFDPDLTAWGAYAAVGLSHSATADATTVSNAELGAVWAREVIDWGRLVMRVGLILPTGTDDSSAIDERLSTHRLADAPLMAPQTFGARLSVSPILIEEYCADFLWWIGRPNTCFLRFDAGVDVYSVHDVVEVLPRAGLGFGMRFPIATGMLEAVTVTDRDERGHPEFHTSLAGTLRVTLPQGWSWWTNFQPGVSAIFPVGADHRDGWVLAFDLHMPFGQGTSDIVW